MDWTSIERSWKHYKASAQERWNRLSGQQMDATLGKREALARCVQLAYGLTREETERRISMWLLQQASNPLVAANS